MGAGVDRRALEVGRCWMEMGGLNLVTGDIHRDLCGQTWLKSFMVSLISIGRLGEGMI